MKRDIKIFIYGAALGIALMVALNTMDRVITIAMQPGAVHSLTMMGE